MKSIKDQMDVVKRFELDYLLYSPEDLKDEKWPLILFLHGSGERGKNIDRVKLQGLPKYLEEGHDLPAFVVAPQCPDGLVWEFLLENLHELVETLCERHPVDPKRIYLTGLSLGGHGTFTMALKYPNLFAALVPICGWYEKPDELIHIKQIPTWIFHGEKDNIVPAASSKKIKEAFEEMGGQVQLTLYPDLKHDSWTKAYHDPELYEWLFKQSN